MLNQCGFTLFEVLLAIMIMSIIAIFSLSGLSHFYISSQEHLLQFQLLHAIEMAAQQAEIRHIPIALSKQKQHIWLGGMLVFINENKDGRPRHKADIINVIQFHHQKGELHWRSFPVYRDYVLFMPDGLMRTDNSLFWYCRVVEAKPAWAIALSKTGRTRTLLPNRTGEILDPHGKPLRC